MDPAVTFQQFVTAINAHDTEAVMALMTGDPAFVDSLGNRIRGAPALKLGWQQYFAMCPDYWIRIEHVMTDGGVVLAAGHAGGTIDGVSWRAPASFKAVVHQNSVAEWQVFADNKPVYEILAKRRQ